MSQIHKKIKEFEVEAFHDGVFKTVRDSDGAGKWGIFFFYPGDFTFVCPTELGDLADHYESFRELNCEIYAISTDSHFAHKAWHDQSEIMGKVKYPMLGDRTGGISRGFGVYREEEGVADRGTFIVDDKGVIQSVEITAPGVGRDAQEILRKLKAAQYVSKNPGEVCPAKWNEGKSTMKPSLELVGKI